MKLTFTLIAGAASLSVDQEWKTVAAKNLAVAGVPDPVCATGVLSLISKETVCCAGYCGECSDYATCKSVRGQDSENACCSGKVFKMRCGGGAAANECLKSCDEAVPPCIMSQKEIKIPKTKRHAGDDCNKAVEAWRKKADAALVPPKSPPKKR